jgi:hypothetical protein
LLFLLSLIFPALPARVYCCIIRVCSKLSNIHTDRITQNYNFVHKFSKKWNVSLSAAQNQFFVTNFYENELSFTTPLHSITLNCLQYLKIKGLLFSFKVAFLILMMLDLNYDAKDTIFDDANKRRKKKKKYKFLLWSFCLVFMIM